MAETVAQYLAKSRAGMRYMAQMTFYNRGDFARLRQFIADSYTAEALQEIPLEDRLEEQEALYSALGKLRVEQVVGAGDHQIIVVVQAQHTGGFFFNQMVVTEDYPHAVMLFAHAPVEGEADEPAP